jgi:16S rRNA (cytosine967-C5)-methyltransferase
MKISPARTAAFDVLLRIETDRAFSAVLLPQYESHLSQKDRGLCHELTLGALRRQMYLDRVIEHYSGEKKLDAAVRVALRLGLYQLYFLDKVPARAAVDESVSLVKRARKTSAKGLVNAILRRSSKEKIELSYVDQTDRLSVETSHPRWLLERWIGQFGTEMAAGLAVANNVVGRHAFRVIGDVRVELGNAAASAFVDGCYLVDKIDRDLIDLSEKGAVYFQDEASQMAAAAVRVPKGGRFLDVCAAPGGKTGLVVRRSGEHLSFAAAGDLYWPRVQTLRENCRRQNASEVNILQYDAEAALPFTDEAFDTVLLDAPCSGTGTIRHNPELRYFLGPSDIPQLAAKQLRILKNASKLVKRGGSVVYSTCSLETEENEELCREFIGTEPAFESIAPSVPARFVTGDGFARTFPDRDEMDGFFVAEFRRK